MSKLKHKQNPLPIDDIKKLDFEYRQLIGELKQSKAEYLRLIKEVRDIKNQLLKEKNV